MRAFAEYKDYDGLGLAKLVQSGEVTAHEVLEAAIERIEALNPKLNAVVTKVYDQARAAAAATTPRRRSPACRSCSRTWAAPRRACPCRPARASSPMSRHRSRPRS